ncbi:PLDc N-terminal domain-containing protein [Curtobacterium sp. VKM Ac-2865]|uniref:PLDc N-terminal domain-containing protein n=1 Tax=Curtobacterium sp. VKM Ac-2865 TaxID=2783817 RepID=UPI00188DA913|nr:PLDc N-terminal domain-containing protein [Curtobacterium sp. VKM Ac-2865]MBF4583207.1 PLDc N-terminal domain-containing protein [Curtobacterium sp. VKM Ac-2865]
MLENLAGAHVLVILIILVLDALALVQVWRDRRRSDLVKVLWTVAIVALPVIGVLGWAVNWLVGRAADRLNRPAGPTA